MERSRMRKGERETNPTTVGCGSTRPLMCRSRMQSSLWEEEKQRVVTVLNAWRVVQDPTGFLG